MKPLIALVLLLACLFHMPRAWAQCAPGIPEAGNPECLPPDDPNSPYYQGSNGQSNGHMPPPQPTVRWADRWGAIATDYTNGNNSLGTSVNMSTRRQAEQAALTDCQAHGGQQCRIETWYGNGCAAFVAGNTTHISTHAETQDQAIEIGIKTCTKGGDVNCKAYYTACSQPTRIQ